MRPLYFLLSNRCIVCRSTVVLAAVRPFARLRAANQLSVARNYCNSSIILRLSEVAFAKPRLPLVSIIVDLRQQRWGISGPVKIDPLSSDIFEIMEELHEEHATTVGKRRFCPKVAVSPRLSGSQRRRRQLEDDALSSSTWRPQKESGGCKSSRRFISCKARKP